MSFKDYALIHTYITHKYAFVPNDFANNFVHMPLCLYCVQVWFGFPFSLKLLFIFVQCKNIPALHKQENGALFILIIF